MDSTARYRFWIVLAGLIALSVPMSPAFAGRVVRVYEVTVRNVNSGATVQDAMRQVLARSTGQRDAGVDPALAKIVSNAGSYVQTYKSAPGGGTQIVFDAAAIERDIVAAGRTVWQRERPFTLVVLNPPLTGAAAESARRALEEAAEARGLPISLVPMTVVDSLGNELGRDVLMQSAQRFGGDAVLVGRSSGAAANSQWLWTLHSRLTTENFTGTLETGVNSAVDALARSQGEAQSLGESEAVVQVKDVRSLADYAAVGRLIEGVPGVRKSTLEEADGTTATFRVLVRGGADTLDRALASAARLERSADAAATGADGRLIYQLRP